MPSTRSTRRRDAFSRTFVSFVALWSTGPRPAHSSADARPRRRRRLSAASFVSHLASSRRRRRRARALAYRYQRPTWPKPWSATSSRSVHAFPSCSAHLHCRLRPRVVLPGHSSKLQEPTLCSFWGGTWRRLTRVLFLPRVSTSDIRVLCPRFSHHTFRDSTSRSFINSYSTQAVYHLYSPEGRSRASPDARRSAPTF